MLNSSTTPLELVLEGVRAAAPHYPLLDDVTYSYGTAGFRCKAHNLTPAAFRVGLLAALRAKLARCTIGVMVTASHNPEEDNGLKVVEPQGEMLLGRWEQHATQICNTESTALAEEVESLAERVGVSITCNKGRVLVGRDTRDSGPEIVQAIKAGAAALNCKVEDMGICTTPQLHWAVKQTNISLPSSLHDYYNTFTTAFLELYGKSDVKQSIKVDCANGVGAVALGDLAPSLAEVLDIEIYNDGSTGKLNYKCGADFVKLMQNPPQGIRYKEGDHCYTIDGDADRSLFFYTQNGHFHMLDGDKIACLFAKFLSELISEAELQLSIGVVQTAYANGSSTHYLTSHEIPVVCVSTGVKHLHKRAHDYDVGVYFEANGHGTVLFSDRAIEMISSGSVRETRKSQKVAIDRLYGFANLINSAVGDAITNILVIETMLKLFQLRPCQWNDLYTDLPYRQLKINIRDRSIVQTTDAERRVSSPPGLQENIDTLVSQYEGARCFVRPSGTEDCVRVHAEARTQREAEKLAESVGSMVFGFTEALVRSKL